MYVYFKILQRLITPSSKKSDKWKLRMQSVFYVSNFLCDLIWGIITYNCKNDLTLAKAIFIRIMQNRSLSRKYTKFEKSCSTRQISFFGQNGTKNH